MGSVFKKMVGTIIAGKYRLDEVVGRGGFSAVYRGEHLAMSRKVAIKVLAPKIITDEDDTSTQRFSQEAKLISQLQSPNTITVFDYGAEDGVFYLVMEYVEGRSLKQILTAGEAPLEPERVARIGVQMLSSLEEAHHYGVLHRDLKPGNIMLARDFRGADLVKVVDFGIAKVIQDSQRDEQANERGLTQENSFVGTPRYAAPEQLFAQKLSTATDLFGIGLIMWDVLVGAPAVSHSSWYDCSSFHMENRKSPMRIPSSAGVPPGLASIIERAVMRHVPQRYQSASDMRQELEAWLADPDAAASANSETFVLPQSEAPSAIGLPAREGSPSLPPNAYEADGLDEDSLVLVRDKQIFDPNLGSAEFFIGEDAPARVELFADMPSSPPMPHPASASSSGIGREKFSASLPAADITGSSPSWRDAENLELDRRVRQSPPRADRAPSTQRAITRDEDTSRDSSTITRVLLAVVGLVVLVVVGAVAAQRVAGGGGDDGSDEVDAIASEEDSSSAPEKPKLPSSRYSDEGILLAIKSAGWKQVASTEKLDLQSFSQRSITFEDGALKCEVTLISGRSAKIVRDLGQAVRPPHRFVSFDNKAVKLTPRNDKSRIAIADLEKMLIRYRKMVDEQEDSSKGTSKE